VGTHPRWQPSITDSRRARRPLNARQRGDGEQQRLCAVTSVAASLSGNVELLGECQPGNGEAHALASATGSSVCARSATVEDANIDRRGWWRGGARIAE
jgi:hypothetical protein